MHPYPGESLISIHPGEMTDLQNAKPHVHTHRENSIVQQNRKGSKASVEIKLSPTVRILER